MVSVRHTLSYARISAYALASVAAGAITAAAAQDAAPQGQGLEDIVVTARKVEENLQQVPVAVTVQTGEALRQQSAVMIPDIARLTPGIRFQNSASNPSASAITIRGQVQTDVLATLDPSVGVYVDGFYWARAYGLNANLLDVQSAQVLRGPQGTLFGRNTTGGALLIQSNDPDYKGVSGNVSATYGRFNERAGTAVLNLPLIDDKLAVRGGFTINKRDGFARNTLTGRKLGENDSYTGRLKVRFDPTDTLHFILSGEWYSINAYSRPYQLIYMSPNSPAVTEVGLEAGQPTQGNTLINNYIASTVGTDRVQQTTDTLTDVKTQTYTMTSTLDTVFGAIKFIGGYRHIRSDTAIDLDASPYDILSTRAHQNLKSYSGELQITGKAFNDAFDFAGGAFVFKEKGTDESTAVALPTITRLVAGFVPRQYLIGDIDNRSMGLYFQGTYHLDDKFSIVGGIRYSVEDKNIIAYNQDRDSQTDALIGCLIGTADPVTCRAVSRKDFDGVSYTAGVNYQVSPDLLVYAKSSKGFRSGGQNLRASGASGAAFAPFRPEVVYEQEVGFKSELFDRRVRFNVAAFYNEVSDIQRTILNVICAADGTCRTATVVGNAGKARFFGGEAEVTARVTEGLTLSGNAALADAKYLRYTDRDALGNVVDRRTEAFQYVPKWTFSVAGDYKRPVGDATLNAHLDYAWQGKTYNYNVETSNPTNDPVIAGLLNAETRRAGGELNGRLGVSFMDDQLEVAVFGRNILNRRYYMSGLVLPAPLSYAMGQRNDPVTYGVNLTYRFGR
ncbi:TonB-dependent receptor [Sphingobium sp. Sx8-8]|uniref:TonB-dependent receptor n=1 Tax=Sphingobium sp. Sx8-8 TaxID=2933617 RepID=UPI001F56FE65|nr:TonB-dependent receptor [Sphingobium sp. Sx8-8]